MALLLKIIRTAKHLKIAQVRGQILNRVRPYWERPASFALRRTPPFPGCTWTSVGSFLPPGAQANTAEHLAEGFFAFVGLEKRIGWPPSDWASPESPKLWQYNLHYFEWLWALDYPTVREIILDWIARHPLDHGQVGWDPYPTSLRLMNWCAVCFGRFQEETLSDETFLTELWRSIALQADWLVRHIETHLLGNHLFENGAALLFSGSCFGQNQALPKRWYETGRRILDREIPEQVLADGMHFERSPMYHVRLTYLMALLRLTPYQSEVADPLARMQSALAKLCHPDGEISLFNDSAFGIHNAPSQLLGNVPAEYGPWSLPDAGYYGWNDSEGNYVVCDAGVIGPDYIPGHAHADLFSFELSLSGRRVIVDSGVYDYVAGDMRAFCRSTRAHNTVEIDGQDQCELWGTFRVARRGYPRDITWDADDDGFTLCGWHDGYTRLRGRPVHQRKIEWKSFGRLTVTDQVRSGQPVRSVSRVHFHPECEIVTLSETTAEIAFPGGRLTVEFAGEGELEREESLYCPEFGRGIPNFALAFTSHNIHSRASYIVSLK